MADLFHKSAIDVVTGFAGIRDGLPAVGGIIGTGTVIKRDLQQFLNEREGAMTLEAATADNARRPTDV